MLLLSFGQQVKKIRTNQGLTQIRLSELTGIVREQISKIEHGQINPTLETINKLCTAFDMKLKDFFDFEVDLNLNRYKARRKNYKTRPFVKWAGGKSQIIEKIEQFLPDKYDTYYEPFIGGGAVLFNLKPNKAVIADTNSELMKAFSCFRDKVSYNKLIEQLIEYEEKHSEEFYYELR